MHFSYKSKHFISALLLLLGINIAPQGIASSATPPYYKWYFTNSGLTYGPTDTIVMEANFVNLDSVDIVIPSTDIGTMFTYGTFPSGAFPGPGDYEFKFMVFDCFTPTPGCLTNSTIGPGETRDFIFGTLTPVTSVNPGTYVSDGAQITLNAAGNIGWTEEEYGGHFVATVTAVPLPGAAWLFVSGIAGLLGFARARKKNLPALRLS